MVRFRIPAVAAAALALVALAGCGAVRPGAQRVAPAAPPSASFLTVTTTPVVIRDRHGQDYLVRYPVSALQLRSIRGGRTTRTLLRSLGAIDAVPAPGGSVLAVVDDGCRSPVLRIDPRTGRSRLIRVLLQPAQEVALSPDGRELAYLTYPRPDRLPCAPARQPARPVRWQASTGGPAQFLPNVLAVVDLASGAVVRAATASRGQPPFDPAWSPSGSQIAVVSTAGNTITLLSAAHPRFAAARRIRPPRGCGYVATTWTTTGLVAVLGCGRRGPDLSPRTLVRLSPTGRRAARWRLPSCIDGVRVVAGAAGRRVLVEADIGYGNGRPCGFPRPGGTAIRIAELGAAGLRTVAAYRQGNYQLELTGW
jgi:hypothetical protein